jgi:hypothetical protein
MLADFEKCTCDDKVPYFWHKAKRAQIKYPMCIIIELLREHTILLAKNNMVRRLCGLTR